MACQAGVVLKTRGDSHELLTGRLLHLLGPEAHAAVQRGDGRAFARWVQLGMLGCARNNVKARAGVRARLSLHGERLSDQCVIDDRIRSMRVKSSENTSAQSPSADTKTIDGCCVLPSRAVEPNHVDYPPRGARC